MSKIAYFDGIKFTEGSMGYMVARINGKNVLMHRYVWGYYNGVIPDGYVIHHKDEDKTNNAIENLECLLNSVHSTYHGKHMSEERRKKSLEALSKARPKAIAWHKSEAGRECSRRNTKRLIAEGILNPTEMYTCANCGKKFLAVKRRAKHKFCSGKCEQYYRRHNGLNITTRVCEICGNEFTTDRYGKTKTCSRSCGMKLAHIHNPTNWRTGEPN